ncbi:MAG: hypothetical protein L0Y80_11605 [Ignavibacteriae bacterium]|nr:hypothetical protein [Ignavibacteriota bacterium]
MNWKLILLVSCLGLLMSVLSIFGLTQGIEPFLWVPIALGSAYILASKLSSKHFLAGLIAGFLMGLINGVMQSSFYDTYIANNPQIAESMNAQPIPGGMTPQLVFLMSGLIVGVVYGIILGLLTFGASKIFKKSAETSTLT